MIKNIIIIILVIGVFGIFAYVIGTNNSTIQEQITHLQQENTDYKQTINEVSNIPQQEISPTQSEVLE